MIALYVQVQPVQMAHSFFESLVIHQHFVLHPELLNIRAIQARVNSNSELTGKLTANVAKEFQVLLG